MKTSTVNRLSLIAIFVLLLGYTSTTLADPVLFVGDIADRSTIQVKSGKAKGQLKLEFCWGGGLNARSFSVIYKESAESPEARTATRKFLDLLRDPRTTEFGDPHLGALLGLKIDRFGEQ